MLKLEAKHTTNAHTQTQVQESSANWSLRYHPKKKKKKNSLLVKFKLGILPLELECGRWKDDPIDTRLCRLCDEGLLDDEYHFTSFCDKLVDKRTKLYIEFTERSEIDISASQTELIKSMYVEGKVLKQQANI